MALALAELIRLIHRPAAITAVSPLAQAAQTPAEASALTAADSTEPHIDHEENEIALRRTA